MKRILKFTACALLLSLIFFLSCKKELSCEGCRDGNKAPIANAGTDQKITFPTDSVMLDGTASTDPDGSITSYKWVKIAGPLSPNVAKPDSSKTLVKTLVAGIYKFELTVTDNGGLSAKDTVQIAMDNPAVNQPPVACAGPDQTITLPANTLTLDGSCSADPDNNITAYNWAKISGPASSNIVNANAVQTQINNLVEGVYQFELKVTDAGGLFSKDTVQVIVNAAIVVYTCGDTNRPSINAQLIPIGTLSQARIGIAAATAGNKLFFGGGLIPPGSLSSRIDIYDLTTQTWSTKELSQPRYDITAIGAGNKIFFAGGELSDGTCPTSTVDIFDVSTNQWSVSSISIAGYGMASAVVGNKVLFSGGQGLFCGSWARGTRVDIYDLTTNSWSIATLGSVRRGAHAAATVNNKVYISGGESWPANPLPGTWFVSQTMDIYDNATNSWSASSLTEGKLGHAGVAVNGKVYWAGGETGSYPNIVGSCSVEIMNANTGSVSIQQLSRPGYLTGVVKNNQIIFFAGDHRFDVYDVVTDKWSIGVLPAGFTGGPIISVNNTIYVVSGVQVYKLNF